MDMPTLLELVEHHRGGAFANHINEQWRSLLAEARDLEAGGAITITVKVTPDPDGLVTIDPTVTVKWPKAPRMTDVYFFRRTDEGLALSTIHPDQPELFPDDGTATVTVTAPDGTTATAPLKLLTGRA